LRIGNEHSSAPIVPISLFKGIGLGPTSDYPKPTARPHQDCAERDDLDLPLTWLQAKGELSVEGNLDARVVAASFVDVRKIEGYALIALENVKIIKPKDDNILSTTMDFAPTTFGIYRQMRAMSV
jgi:hypothetical protein